MSLLLEELLCLLPDHERASFLRLPKANQQELRSYIMNSARLPRSSGDLMCAPGTVSGPAVGRARECERGRVGLR